MKGGAPGKKRCATPSLGETHCLKDVILATGYFFRGAFRGEGGAGGHSPTPPW